MTTVVFLDTETVGLHPITDHIWEVAALRCEPGQPDEALQFFVEHTPPGREYLDSTFAADYQARFNPERAIHRIDAVERLRHIFRNRAHLVAAVPSFDAERLGVMRRLAGFGDEPDPWHYHLIDVEALAVGYLRAKRQYGHHRTQQLIQDVTALPWDSNALSLTVGVDPEQFARHTAMGDVLWARAIYDAVMNL